MKTKFFKFSKFVCKLLSPDLKSLFLFLTITFFAIQTSAFSNVTFTKSGKPGSTVENVRYSVADQKVIINYDLNGTAGKQYSIKLILKKQSDQNYQYIPSVVSGDVGKNQSPGKDKQIVWDISEEFPGGLFGKDYYFVVEATEINNNPSILSWIGVGVAAVAATATYLIISKKISNNNSSSGSSSFPLPPGRP